MRGRKLATVAMGLSAATVLLSAAAASASTAAPASSNNCTPPEPFAKVCLYIQGMDLYVQSAKVTNEDEPTGYGYIENEGDHAIHHSPYLLSPGVPWTYTFNRDVTNDDEICGWIGSAPKVKACGQVHA